MLDEIARSVRRHDPDRFLTTLFAPAARRDALFTLYAFNHELARAREVASAPPLALIRLQWWREVVDGTPHRYSAGHPVADRLAGLLAAGVLDRDDLLRLIDAREIEAEPHIETTGQWRAYVQGTAGGLAVAAARLLGVAEPETLRPSGAAYGVAGVLRSVPMLARQGRCLLPADLLAQHGLEPAAVVPSLLGAPGEPLLHAVFAALAAIGRDFLRQVEAMRLPATAVAVALPSVLARRDLARAPSWPAARGVGDRLAVTWAGLLRRA